MKKNEELEDNGEKFLRRSMRCRSVNPTSTQRTIPTSSSTQRLPSDDIPNRPKRSVTTPASEQQRNNKMALRTKNSDPLQALQNANNTTAQVVVDMPSTSRNVTPDQENTIKLREVKREPNSKEPPEVQPAPSRKRGRPRKMQITDVKMERPKKSKPTESEPESEPEHVFSFLSCDAEDRALPQGDYERISDKWDEYRDECTSLSKDKLNGVTKQVLVLFNEVKDHYNKSIIVPDRERFATLVKSGGMGKKYQLPEEFRAKLKPPLILRKHQKTRFKGMKMLPRMRYWIHSEQNILVDDNLRLSHIPYVHELHDDFEWVNELRNFYYEGIHGADRGCGQHINDYLMFRLITELQTKTKNLKCEMKDICFAIFTLFPNKYSFRELSHPDFIATLKRRFEHISPPADPNIDNTLQYLMKNVCQRDGYFFCMEHDDHAHEFHHVPPPVGSIVKGTKTCGATCGQSSLKDHSTPPSKIVAVLSPAESKIFTNRLHMNDVDICKIAKSMNAIRRRHGLPEKTCYEYSQLAKAESQIIRPPRVKALTERERHNGFRVHFRRAIDNSYPFEPCNHHGECHDPKNKCKCFANGSACTRFCRCGPACPIVFPGCRCTPGMCRTDSCPCHLANWECNPLTCISCRSTPSALDQKCCGNISIQLGLKKKIRVGVSQIATAGYGCFVLEEASKGELISEYTGELISNDETERRGSIQDKMKLSYVFTLNNQQVIDALRVGNIIRFANHSNTPNCIAKTVIVDGMQRIGIYAKRDIKAGEELYFDYRYKTDQKKAFVNGSSTTQKGKKKLKA